MDTQLIQQLVRLMKRGELTELEIDDQGAGLRVHLKRGSEAGGSSPLVNVLQGGGMLPAGVPGGEAGAAAAASAGPEAASAALAASGPPPGTVVFESPMVGTFYRASSPDSDPFVEVGSKVDENSTLCIVEAMKVMNEIKAELRGMVAEILVENGEPVEFGQPLFLIRKG